VGGTEPWSRRIESFVPHRLTEVDRAAGLGSVLGGVGVAGSPDGVVCVSASRVAWNSASSAATLPIISAITAMRPKPNVTRCRQRGAGI